MDHDGDFQDVVSELFKNRQEANVSVISCADYTLKHRVCFTGAVTTRIRLKTGSMATWLQISHRVFLPQSDQQTSLNSTL